MIERGPREVGPKQKQTPDVEKGERIMANNNQGETAISRRKFLKRGVGFLIAAGAVVAGYGIFSDREEPIRKAEEKPQRPTASRIDIQPPDREAEKMEPVDAVKAMLREYNSWLNGLQEGKISQVDGTAKFVEIYNRHIKNIKADLPIPSIDFSKFNKTGNPNDFFSQIEPLRRLLEKNNFYIRAVPSEEQWKGETIRYMAVQVGEIKNAEVKKVARRGKEAAYRYVIVASPPNDDAQSSYQSGPTWFTALTYNENGSTVVMQSEEGYAKSSKIIYETLQREPRTLKERAIHTAFSSYKTGDESKNLQAIQNIIMGTSLIHEEQHVLDGHLEEMVLSAETLPKHIVTEMRGILAPFASKYPKVALENILNWSISPNNIKAAIGQMTVQILEELSGKPAVDLLSSSDSDLKSLGERAMQIADMYFERVIEQNMPIADEEAEQQYRVIVDALKDSKQ